MIARYAELMGKMKPVQITGAMGAEGRVFSPLRPVSREVNRPRQLNQLGLVFSWPSWDMVSCPHIGTPCLAGSWALCLYPPEGT